MHGSMKTQKLQNESECKGTSGCEKHENTKVKVKKAGLPPKSVVSFLEIFVKPESGSSSCLCLVMCLRVYVPVSDKDIKEDLINQL
jgi:hypothetical protein